MKTYVSSILVSAVPKARQEYNRYRGWKTPSNEDPEDGGFMFENRKGNSNHKKHKGYISWLPYLEFMAQFTAVGGAEGKPAHQQRVMAELAELVKKLEALKVFFTTDIFLKCSFEERDLLQEQSRLMTQYVNVLESRIALFK